jgi:ribosomal protein S11
MICSLLSPFGKLFKTVASGHFRFNGTMKGTQAAAQKLAYFLEQSLLERGFDECSIHSTGYFRKTRHFIFKELNKKNINTTRIVEHSMRVHNGCKVPNAKR